MSAINSTSEETKQILGCLSTVVVLVLAIAIWGSRCVASGNAYNTQIAKTHTDAIVECIKAGHSPGDCKGAINP